MNSLKKYKVTISLFFILILAAVLCVYKLHTYNGTTNTKNENKIEQNVQAKDQNNMPSQSSLKAPGNQNNASGKSQGSTQNQGPGQGSNPGSGKTQGQNQSGAPEGKSMQGALTASSSISPLLIAYSVIFFFVFITAYFIITYKKIKLPHINIKLFLIVLLSASFLLHIAAATLMNGYSGDINLSKSWAVSAANNFTQFYAGKTSSDYPPLYIYVLFIIGKLINISTLSNYTVILLKLPSIIADVAASYVIYKVAKKHFSTRLSVLLCAFYMFNPAVFINSTFWGQVDSFFSLIVVLAVYSLSEKKTGLATVFWYYIRIPLCIP